MIDIAVTATDEHGNSTTQTVSFTLEDAPESIQLDDSGVTFADEGVAEQHIDGGAGDDTLMAGAGAGLTGGTGEDQFMAGNWTGTEQTVQLMDFDTDEDKLVLVWDFEDGEEPSVELQQNPEAEDEQVILVDGEPALRVTGAGWLTAADLVLIDPVSAAATGLLPQ